MLMFFKVKVLYSKELVWVVTLSNVKSAKELKVNCLSEVILKE